MNAYEVKVSYNEFVKLEASFFEVEEAGGVTFYQTWVNEGEDEWNQAIYYFKSLDYVKLLQDTEMKSDVVEADLVTV